MASVTGEGSSSRAPRREDAPLGGAFSLESPEYLASPLAEAGRLACDQLGVELTRQLRRR